MLQALAPQDAQVSMPPILKQQLLDRVAVLDYEGAIAVARELETFDPEGAKGLSAWLANDLSWEYAKDVGMSTWVSLGNGGLYTAFFARYFSPAAVRNAPVSLTNAKADLHLVGRLRRVPQFHVGPRQPVLLAHERRTDAPQASRGNGLADEGGHRGRGTGRDQEGAARRAVRHGRRVRGLPRPDAAQHAADADRRSRGRCSARRAAT